MPKSSRREGEFPEGTEACPVCGADGPCSLDDSGRPLVHTDLEVTQ